MKVCINHFFFSCLNKAGFVNDKEAGDVGLLTRLFIFNIGSFVQALGGIVEWVSKYPVEPVTYIIQQENQVLRSLVNKTTLDTLLNAYIDHLFGSRRGNSVIERNFYEWTFTRRHVLGNAESDLSTEVADTLNQHNFVLWASGEKISLFYRRMPTRPDGDVMEQELEEYACKALRGAMGPFFSVQVPDVTMGGDLAKALVHVMERHGIKFIKAKCLEGEVRGLLDLFVNSRRRVGERAMQSGQMGGTFVPLCQVKLRTPVGEFSLKNCGRGVVHTRGRGCWRMGFMGRAGGLSQDLLAMMAEKAREGSLLMKYNAFDPEWNQDAEPGFHFDIFDGNIPPDELKIPSDLHMLGRQTQNLAALKLHVSSWAFRDCNPVNIVFEAMQEQTALTYIDLKFALCKSFNYNLKKNQINVALIRSSVGGMKKLECLQVACAGVDVIPPWTPGEASVHHAKDLFRALQTSQSITKLTLSTMYREDDDHLLAQPEFETTVENFVSRNKLFRKWNLSKAKRVMEGKGQLIPFAALHFLLYTSSCHAQGNDVLFDMFRYVVSDDVCVPEKKLYPKKRAV